MRQPLVFLGEAKKPSLNIAQSNMTCVFSIHTMNKFIDHTVWVWMRQLQTSNEWRDTDNSARRVWPHPLMPPKKQWLRKQGIESITVFQQCTSLWHPSQYIHITTVSGVCLLRIHISVDKLRINLCWFRTKCCLNITNHTITQYNKCMQMIQDRHFFEFSRFPKLPLAKKDSNLFMYCMSNLNYRG